jgi:O-antigen ligase
MTLEAPLDARLSAEARPVASPTVALMGWVGFTLLLFYVIVIGGGWLGMYNDTIRLLDVFIAGIALLVWFVVCLRSRSWRPTTAIWPAFLAGFVAFGLSLAFSEYRQIGLEILAYAVVLVALYLLLVRIMALPYARARIGGTLAAMAVVLGGAYVIWSLALWVQWWGLVGAIVMPPLRPALLGMTWGSPSVVMSVLVLLTVAAIGGIGWATRANRITVAVLVGLLAVVAFISGSRSGWLAMGGAVVIVGGLSLVDTRGRALLEQAWHSRTVRLAAVPVAIIGVLLVVALGPTVLSRLDSGDGGRLTWWASAARMFVDSPLVGQGPGTWMIRRAAYTQPGEMDWYQPHAHSQYMQTGAELGLVGLAMGALAFVAVGWLLLGALRGRDPLRRRWAWASLFGLVYIGLDVVVDTHTIPTVALLMAMPIAVLDATSDHPIGLPRRLTGFGPALRLVAVVALVFGSLGGLVVLGRAESVELTFQRAVIAAGEGDWATALAPALDAADSAPEIGPYQMTAALAESALGDWAGAAERFQNVVGLDGLAQAWLGLARAGVGLGWSSDDVAHALDEALRLGVQQPAVTYAAARVYDLAGLSAEADRAYALALIGAPGLAADESWRADLGGHRADAVIETAMTMSPGQAWDIALNAGNVAQASALVADGPDAGFRQHVVEAWAGDQAAYAQVKAMTDATPTDGVRLALAARLADHLDDADTARRYRRMIRIGAFYAPAATDLVVGQRDPVDDAATGESTYYYGTYTYRRSLLLDLLPPGLPGLVPVGGHPGDDTAAQQTSPG